MRNFVLQTGPCSFLYLRIGPWGKLFILLLCSFNPGALIFFHWQHYHLVPSYPHPILSFSLYLLPHAVQIRVAQQEWASARRQAQAQGPERGASAAQALARRAEGAEARR
jgi:hypothetical protein